MNISFCIFSAYIKFVRYMSINKFSHRHHQNRPAKFWGPVQELNLRLHILQIIPNFGIFSFSYPY